jgi:hypothetical protein
MHYYEKMAVKTMASIYLDLMVVYKALILVEVLIFKYDQSMRRAPIFPSASERR